MTITHAILTALRYADEHPRLDPDTAIEASLARNGWALRQTAGAGEWPHQIPSARLDGVV